MDGVILVSVLVIPITGATLTTGILTGDIHIGAEDGDGITITGTGIIITIIIMGRGLYLPQMEDKMPGLLQIMT
jgi:hypothetical protein